MTAQAQQIGPGFVVEISGIQLGDSLSDDDLLNFTQRMGPLFHHVRSLFHSPS